MHRKSPDKHPQTVSLGERILRWRKVTWAQYAIALGAFAGTSLINVWLESWSGYQAIALTYLLAVVLLALFADRGPILFGTALSALGWNFLFVPPRYSFHIGSFYDKMMLAMYFVVALTVGQLTARLRVQREENQKREKRATALYLLTRELAQAPDVSDILARSAKHVGNVFDAQVAVMVPGTKEPLSMETFPGGTWELSTEERNAAKWAFEHDQPTGGGFGGAFETEGLHLPLSAGSRPGGVLSLRLHSNERLAPEQRELLENFARQIALGLDRQRLRDTELTTSLLKESERLGRTLLNSVSHELRTPIAAISSAAGSFRTSGAMTPVQQHLVTEIESASSRLNRLVQSLLSAARLQSGQIRPKLDWCEIGDLVRVTLRNLGKVLADHPVEKQLSADLPLIKADFVLLEQALANLVVNAATHTPSGTPIELHARVHGKELVLEVADKGPGLQPDQIQRIFDLFHRAPGAKPGGTGLGLAITKGFVEAQGGRVQAANRAGGGCIFSIWMPMTDNLNLPDEAL